MMSTSAPPSSIVVHTSLTTRLDAQGSARKRPKLTAAVSTVSSYSGDETLSSARTVISKEERIRLTRERNCVNARRMRSRKQECVKELQAAVQKLERDRNLLMEQELMEARSLSQVRNARRTILRQFLSCLVHYETDENIWRSLVDRNFWLKQPVTPFRSFNNGEIEDGPCRIARGIPGIISEAASLSVMIDSIGSRNKSWMERKASEFYDYKEHKYQPNSWYLATSDEDATLHSTGTNNSPVHPMHYDANQGSIPQIQASFHVNEDDMATTGNVLMCPYTFCTRGAVLCGATADINIPGMIRAQFSPKTNKLLMIELIYDAMGFIHQLEHAGGSMTSSPIVPNSLEMALFPSTTEARVITLAIPPFPIVHVNGEFTKLTKRSQSEAEGQQLSIIYGPDTDWVAAARPAKPVHESSEVAMGRSACSINKYYTKNGDSFLAFMSSYPLTNDDGVVGYLLHTLQELTHLVDEDVAISIKSVNHTANLTALMTTDSHRRHSDDLDMYGEVLSNFFESTSK